MSEAAEVPEETVPSKKSWSKCCVYKILAGLFLVILIGAVGLFDHFQRIHLVREFEVLEGRLENLEQGMKQPQQAPHHLDPAKIVTLIQDEILNRTQTLVSSLHEKGNMPSHSMVFESLLLLEMLKTHGESQPLMKVLDQHLLKIFEGDPESLQFVERLKKQDEPESKERTAGHLPAYLAWITNYVELSFLHESPKTHSPSKHMIIVQIQEKLLEKIKEESRHD